jgi:hypothetical protein
VATGEAGKLAYPKLLSSDHRLFWLAAYLRDLAEAQALYDLYIEVTRRKRSEVVRYATIGAWGHARNEACCIADHVLRDGLILFAHPATTALDEVPA